MKTQPFYAQNTLVDLREPRLVGGELVCPSSLPPAQLSSFPLQFADAPITLNSARKILFPLQQPQLDFLLELYARWVQTPTYLAFEKPFELDKKNSYHKICCMLASKRGNSVYVSRLKKKLHELKSNLEQLPPELFVRDQFGQGRKFLTSVIWVSLTTDPKLYNNSIDEAWKGLQARWHRWICWFRKTYGKSSVIKPQEATEGGYPHIHAIIVCHEHSFDCSPHINKDGHKIFLLDANKTLYFKNNIRITKFSEKWGSIVDVKAVASVEKLVEYIFKDVVKQFSLFNSVSCKKTNLTLALNWIYRKRSLTVSSDFPDLIKPICITETSLNREVVEKFKSDGWKFCGVINLKFGDCLPPPFLFIVDVRENFYQKYFSGDCP